MRISDWSSDVCSSDLRRLSRFSLILYLDWICHGRANLRGASSVLRCWPKELARRTLRPRRLEDGVQAWPTDPPLTALKAIQRNPCQPSLLYYNRTRVVKATRLTVRKDLVDSSTTTNKTS